MLGTNYSIDKKRLNEKGWKKCHWTIFFLDKMWSGRNVSGRKVVELPGNMLERNPFTIFFLTKVPRLTVTSSEKNNYNSLISAVYLSNLPRSSAASITMGVSI